MRPKSPTASARGRVVRVVLASALLASPAARAAVETSFTQAALTEGLFTQFVGLIRKAGLEDKLGSGPSTVFMPTDGAFRRLPAKQRDAILGLSPDFARQFVEHYVVPNVALASADIPKSVTMSDGTALEVAWRKGGLSLFEGTGGSRRKIATFVDGDVRAGKGIIQAIDTIVLPPVLKAEIDRVAAGGQAAASAPGDTQQKPADTGKAPDGSTAKADEGSVSSEAPPTDVSGRPAEPGASAAVPGGTSPPLASGEPVPDRAVPAASPPAASPSAAIAVPVSPTTDKNDAGKPTPAGTATVANTGGANTGGANPAPGSAPNPEKSTAPTQAAPTQTAAAVPENKPAPAGAPAPEVSVTARELAGWRVHSSDGKLTGSVERLVLGLPAGQVVGISARFNAIFGLGGKRVFVPWSKVTADPQGHTLKLGMTAAEVNAAPK